MRKLITLALLLYAIPTWASGGGTCPGTVPSGITNCFFISKSGTASNSNNGTTETTEWTAMPGMPSCTSTCAGHTPTAGEGYIFRGGGDTWGASDLGFIYHGSFGSGTASNPVYIGVDKTWFAGASWTRPIFSCANAACSTGTIYFTIGNNSIQYIFIDNLEFTGLHTASQQQYISLGGNHDKVTNNYFHGWDHTGASSDNGIAVATQSGISGDLLDSNVCDGSDTTKDMMGCYGSTAGADAWKEFSRNVCINVVNCQNGSIDTAHDNFFQHIVNSFNPGHANAWQATGSTSVTNVLFYNNVLTDVQNGGDGQYWLGQGNNTGNTWYEFDNVMYNTAAGNNINFSQSTSSGTHWMFNNTFECGSVANGLNPCINGAAVTVALNLHLINNHCITSTGTASCSNGVGSGLTLSESNTLVQTTTQANANTTPHFDQYTESQTPPMSPVSATNSTVSAGLNEQSLCTTITAINAAAGTACQNSTGFACTYNTTPHTVTCPSLALTARPTSAVWDIGAYQFSATPPSSAPAPAMFAGTVTLEGTVIVP